MYNYVLNCPVKMTALQNYLPDGELTTLMTDHIGKY